MTTKTNNANKTVATEQSVAAYIAALPDAQRQAEAKILDRLYAQITGEKAKMWGPSIIGYGQYHYRTEAGREGVMCRLAFSPRKAEIVLYALGNAERFGTDHGKLGKVRTGKGCLYLKRLEGIDMDLLADMLRRAWSQMNATYPT